MIKADLLIIDPQIDFCDPAGALYVKGADDDMKRLATLIDRTSDKLHDIHVTLDTHHLLDVAHPLYWKDTAGKHPAPFTIITEDDVKNGIWTTTIPSFQKRAADYVRTLAKNGRYPLCIWPPHCLIGSNGHRVYPEVFDALQGYENAHACFVNYVTKGSNLHTEHYSAIQADVPDPSDAGTWINTNLITTLESVDIIGVAGEASSHCVANSLRDVISNFKDSTYAKKIVLLTDAMSPVTGFEDLATKFFDDMRQLGVSFSTTKDFLA